MKAGPNFDQPRMLEALGRIEYPDDILVAAWMNDLRTTQISYTPTQSKYVPSAVPAPTNPERIAALYAPEPL
jgi:hypothetical protein